MSPRRAVPTAGFTLVELLIGVALSAMLMAAVLSTYIYLARNLARLAHQQTLEAEARRTLGYFTQDVQTASGVFITPVGAPDFQVALFQPASGEGVSQVTYCYSRNGGSFAIGPDNIDVAAHTLVRVRSTGSAITGSPQIVLRQIVDTDEGCYARFFDGTGKPYDNDASPYTPITTYSSGIKQISLHFSTQTGNVSNGTQTRVQTVTSARLLLRNRSAAP